MAPTKYQTTYQFMTKLKCIMAKLAVMNTHELTVNLVRIYYYTEHVLLQTRDWTSLDESIIRSVTTKLRNVLPIALAYGYMRNGSDINQEDEFDTLNLMVILHYFLFIRF